MKVNNQIIFTNQAMNESFTSIPLQLNLMLFYAFQGIWTGTPNGYFFLEGSCDANYPSSGAAPSHWSTIGGSTVTVVAAGDFLINVANIGYNWVRLQYVDSSGGISNALLTSCTFNEKGE